MHLYPLKSFASLFEPAKATSSIILPLSVSPLVRNAIDLGNRSNDFPETWHEVEGQ